MLANFSVTISVFKSVVFDFNLFCVTKDQFVDIRLFLSSESWQQ